MPRKFLVPLDLASETPRELTFAADLAKALDAEVILLHVVDYLPTLLPVEVPGGYPLPQLDIVRGAATTKMQRIAAKAGVPDARTQIETGAAAEQIVAFAKRERVDQIILGSHSHQALARMVLGSVADRVAHTATCPVTIVRDLKH